MNNKDTILYLGIDVAKQELVFVADGQSRAQKVPNKPEGHGRIIEHIHTLDRRCCVVVESTGGYEYALLEALLNAGIEAAVVLPQRVRDYARSQGHLAKTDAIDAAVIAEFARISQPRHFQKQDQLHHELKALHKRREDLVKERTREQNRLDTAPKRLGQLIEDHLRYLKKHIAEIEQQIEALIDSSDQLQARQQRLCQIQSIGPVVSRALLVGMPELGTLTDNQAAALAGVAPYNNDSGQSSKKARTRGGRSSVRSLLYMASVVASRHNPVLAPFYQKLIARGKPTKVALTAVMRKLIIIANRSLRDPNFQLA
jgi:transposase